ncbi:hypothetical protein DY000_02040478 [Brassica cretica]|uniref:Uncharacterized protein n=1 Tax=Brassica cretica TaxID=69181 RepID=A0ABQ7B861_BRACR|nr:hypothetical protein DY000_02040478 [Brassica cretica]
MSSSNYFRSWIDRPHLDPNTRLLTEEYQRGTCSSEYTEGLIPRNIPRDLFLGIFRGFISSEIPDENSEEHFVGTSEVDSEEVLPRYIPRSFPTNWWSSEFPRKFVSSEFRRKTPRDFRGKMNFRGVISEDLFRRTKQNCQNQDTTLNNTTSELVFKKQISLTHEMALAILDETSDNSKKKLLVESFPTSSAPSVD